MACHLIHSNKHTEPRSTDPLQVAQKTVTSRLQPPEPTPPPPPPPSLWEMKEKWRNKWKSWSWKKLMKGSTNEERNVRLSKLMALDITWNNFSIVATYKINLASNSRWISYIWRKGGSESVANSMFFFPKWSGPHWMHLNNNTAVFLSKMLAHYWRPLKPEVHWVDRLEH